MSDPERLVSADVAGLAAAIERAAADLAVACGFSADGRPLALQIVGRPFDEATVLRVGHAYQQATAWHLERPRLETEAR